MKRILPALALAASMAACTTTSPDVVGRGDAQRLSTVVDAVVLSTRPVVVEGNQSGLGASAGAVVGGVVGNAAERMATREDALEILVQLKSGERRAIVQARAGENFAAGDPVLLVTTGGKVRVTRAPAVPAGPQTGTGAPRT